VLNAWISGYRRPIDIARVINANPNSVRATLSKLRKKGIITTAEPIKHITSLLDVMESALEKNDLKKLKELLTQIRYQVNVLRKYYEFANLQ